MTLRIICQFKWPSLVKSSQYLIVRILLCKVVGVQLAYLQLTISLRVVIIDSEMIDLTAFSSDERRQYDFGLGRK